MSSKKEVNFNKYCPKCMYHDLNENGDPCNDCLAWGYNIDSKKPVFFKEKLEENDNEHK